MYYLYYGIWLGLKSRLSKGVVLGIELGFLSLVALLGILFICFGIDLLKGVSYA